MATGLDRAMWRKEDCVGEAIPAFRLAIDRPGGTPAAMARWIVRELSSIIGLSSPGGYTDADKPKDAAALTAMERLQVAMTNEIANGATAASLRTYLAAQLQQACVITVS